VRKACRSAAVPTSLTLIGPCSKLRRQWWEAGV